MDEIERSLQNIKYLLEEGRNREAILDLVHILKGDIRQERAWYLLAMALDDPEEKRYALEHVLSLNPQHLEARQDLTTLLAGPEETELSELDQALVLLKQKQHVEARKLLKDYLTKFPDDERAWYLLGIAHHSPSQKARAFKKVLEINPSNEKARQALQNLERRFEKKPVEPVVSQPTPSVGSKIALSTFYRLGKYILVRSVTILLTIFVGIFITVLISNKNGQLDQNITKKIETLVRHEVGLLNTDEKREELSRVMDEARESAGLNLPYLPRHLRWTLNAMKFDWGNVMYGVRVGMFIRQDRLTKARDILLDRLPNSLILIGAANLIIFLVGIPMALRLSRQRNTWQDKLFSFLSPISSIPSWIHGVILILVFSIELKLLPPSGMLDLMPPQNKWEYILIVGRHMILPVSAIVLSLIFQLIYTWRTYFLIYSSEDYVELATAKGLSYKTIEKKYILKPSAPFVLTSFSLTLVGFWQMVIALEIIFNWPGIGQLYLEALPNFWSESMFPGEMTLSVSLVVLFAYLLGIIVLVLDVVYAMIDPRVRIGNISAKVFPMRAKPKMRRLSRQRKAQRPKRPEVISIPTSPGLRKSIKAFFRSWFDGLKKGFSAVANVLSGMRDYPSAMVGLFIIVILIAGSLYAVIGMPYAEIGSRWYSESVTGHLYVPKLAQPSWMNMFRKKDLLSTIILDSRQPDFEKTKTVVSEESSTITFEFTFDYDYAALPDELILRVVPQFQEKRPFVNLTWITPDQRELELKGFSADTEQNFDLIDLIPNKLRVDSTLVEERANDKYGNIYALPFFIPPDEAGETPISGIYKLRVDGMVFEPEGDLDAELILLGQVYGAAGTDIMRRDLLVPLLWGMPFALLFGLCGATATTVLSMLLAAVGTWYGGWLDTLIQRLNEGVMLLPVLAVAVLFYAFFNISIWWVLIIMVVLNIFGSPLKSFRAAFLQVRESPYVESAQAYGASNGRIITRYLIPRIIPVLIPQLVALTPGYVFLEATLGLFNINSVYPTWGKVIHDALRHGFSWGSRYWVLEPIALVLLTGFAFAMIGFALDQILNPKLKGL